MRNRISHRLMGLQQQETSLEAEKGGVLQQQETSIEAEKGGSCDNIAQESRGVLKQSQCARVSRILDAVGARVSRSLDTVGARVSRILDTQMGWRMSLKDP